MFVVDSNILGLMCEFMAAREGDRALCCLREVMPLVKFLVVFGTECHALSLISLTFMKASSVIQYVRGTIYRIIAHIPHNHVNRNRWANIFQPFKNKHQNRLFNAPHVF